MRCSVGNRGLRGGRERPCRIPNPSPDGAAAAAAPRRAVRDPAPSASLNPDGAAAAPAAASTHRPFPLFL